MTYVYHKGELGYWTDHGCDCEHCEVQEFVVVFQGPYTKEVSEHRSLLSGLYNKIIEEQLRKPITLEFDKVFKTTNPSKVITFEVKRDRNEG